MSVTRAFRSDNNAGACPEALAAIAEAMGERADHALGYGDDPWTTRARTAVRGLFGEGCEAFFLATGTAANTLAIASLTRPWQRVLCHSHSHWNDDESTAPELFTGCRTTLVEPWTRGAPPHHDRPIPSKVTGADIERAAGAVSRGDVHQAAPGCVTISNPTEFGEVYSPEEVRAVCEAAHGAGYLVHVDGARFANAVAHAAGDSDDAGEIGRACRALTADAGVDALSLGGTKNGLPLGEAVVFFHQGNGRAFDRAAEEFPWRRKQAGHLLSKHRLVTAPFAAVLETGAWIRHAAHANAMAGRLAEGLRAQGLALPYSTDANGVFVVMPPHLKASLEARGHGFYMFGDPAWGLARLMCSFDTSEANVDGLLTDVASAGGADDGGR